MCERNVLALAEQRILVERPQNCDCCGDCQEACPEEAIDCAFEIVWDQNDERSR